MQAATINPPVTYSGTPLVIPEDENKIRLEAPRYVFCIGDFIEQKDKRQLASAGGWTGGLKIGQNESTGAPTMWRSKGIINRAVFTPLEAQATQAHDDIDTRADSRFQGIHQVGDIWLRQVLPGRDIAYVTDNEHREMGVVEISQLADVAFGLGLAQELNRKFFPELDKWLDGTEPFPTLLSDYETLIQTAKVNSDMELITQEEMMESVRRFTQYANAQIEANYQAIQRSRLVDMGGFGVKWSARTRLFAEQLGRTLEDDIASKVAETKNTDETALRAREIELREETNRIEREKLELLKMEFEAKSKVAEVVETKKGK